MTVGRVLVLGMIALGVVAASVAWWFRYQQSRRSLAYWGIDDVQTIRQAERAEYWYLVRAESAVQPADIPVWSLAGRSYLGRECKDVRRAPGFLHIREALLDDETFRWNQPVSADAPSSTLHALAFYRGQELVVVAFDPLTWAVWTMPPRRPLDASPRAGLWKRWFSEQRAPATVEPSN